MLLLLLAACRPAAVLPTDPPATLDPANIDSASLRLELFVDDVQTSVDFYTGVLGFDMSYGDSSYAVVRAGSVSFGIGPKDGLGRDHYFNPELGEQRGGLGVEIVIEVDDVQNLYDAVVASGWPRESELEERSWGLTDFRVADPDGYYLRLTSRE